MFYKRPIKIILFVIFVFNTFFFQGIKDFYERLSEPETDMLLSASKQFSGLTETIEKIEDEEDRNE